MNITKTMVNNEVTELIDRETRPDRGGDWARKYLSEEAVEAFMSLNDDERCDALRAVGLGAL
jgi:hypothetical protein